MRYSNSDRIRRPFKAEIMGLNPIYRTKYNNGVIFNKKNQKIMKKVFQVFSLSRGSPFIIFKIGLQINKFKNNLKK